MSYLNDAVDRIELMMEEAVSGADAVDYLVHWQDGFPYFTVGFRDYQPGEVLSDQSQRIYIAEIRFYAGYITEDQPGQVEQTIYTHLPVIQDYIEEHQGLETSALSTLRYLDPTQTRLLASPVVVNLGKGVAGTDVLGSIIRVQVTFNVEINQE
jgi:hypothetical protein